jgi:hypothetical protein
MMRSSAEAQIRQSNSQIRPDDLRDCVLAFQGSAARKEFAAQRLTLRKDVAVYFGEDPKSTIPQPLTDLWMQHVQTDDVWMASQELSVTVEAGTGRRPNKEKQIADIQDAAQTLLPVYMQVYTQTGDPTQCNAFIAKWCEAMDIGDPSGFMLPPLQMQPQVPPQPGGDVPPDQQSGEIPPDQSGGAMLPPEEQQPQPEMAMMQ